MQAGQADGLGGQVRQACKPGRPMKDREEGIAGQAEQQAGPVRMPRMETAQEGHAEKPSRLCRQDSQRRHEGQAGR